MGKVVTLSVVLLQKIRCKYVNRKHIDIPFFFFFFVKGDHSETLFASNFGFQTPGRNGTRTKRRWSYTNTARRSWQANRFRRHWLHNKWNTQKCCAYYLVSRSPPHVPAPTSTKNRASTPVDLNTDHTRYHPTTKKNSISKYLQASSLSQPYDTSRKTQTT